MLSIWSPRKSHFLSNFPWAIQEFSARSAVPCRGLLPQLLRAEKTFTPLSEGSAKTTILEQDYNDFMITGLQRKRHNPVIALILINPALSSSFRVNLDVHARLL